MTTTPEIASLPGITHHHVDVNGIQLHYVEAGTTGSPILLVHGFPETWWAFHKLIPLLAANHRVFAVDLRGFGDSGNEAGEYDSATSAEDLHQLQRTWELSHRLLASELVTRHTLFREETRWPGYYYRGDHMKLDDGNWHCFTLSRYDRNTGSWAMEKAPVYHIVD